MEINCIIVDDEPLARKGIIRSVEGVPFLRLLGCYANPIEAMAKVDWTQVDLMFLDIQMPRMTGLELLKSLPQKPLTIIITAYHQFAVDGFELEVMDYILKPYAQDRFHKAAQKAKEYLELVAQGKTAKMGNREYFFVKCDGTYQKILFAELQYVQAMQNYVVLKTIGRQFICYLSLGMMEEYLPADLFIKVQKSFIVAFAHIEAVDSESVWVNSERINLSRKNKDEIIARILGNDVLRR